MSGSVLVFIQALTADNGQAPTTSSPSGWVAVLQPAADPSSPRVGFAGQEYEPQTPDWIGLAVASSTVGPHPYTTYTVSACGPHRYTGALLLLGGGARLTLAGPSPATAPNSTIRLQTVNDLRLRVRAALQPARFDSVQVIQLYLPAVQSCQATPLFSGFATAYGVGGYLREPIEQSWRRAWDWWSGPQLSQTWPLVGAIPGLGSGFSGGPIEASKGIAGAWDLPVWQSVQVTSAPIALTSTVDMTSPPVLPNVTRELGWSSKTGPIVPVAVLTDTASASTMQTTLGIAGLVAGAAVALAFTLLVDALRTTGDHPGPSLPSSLQNKRHPITMAAVVIAALVLYAPCVDVASRMSRIIHSRPTGFARIC